MTLSVLFWLLMIIWLIFGVWSEYIPNQPYPVRRIGQHFIIFVLLAILGWAKFGPPVQ